MELKAIEYECDNRVTIRVCPAEDFYWGTAPEYWYIRRPLFVMDHEEVGISIELLREMKANNFTVLYWRDSGWWPFMPKKFNTPQEAWIEWNEKINVNRSKECQI